MFKRIQTSASIWTEKDLSRLLVQARNAYEQDELEKCNRMLEVLLTADPGNSEARALKDKARGTSPAVLEWPEEDAEIALSNAESNAPHAVETPVKTPVESVKPRSRSRTFPLKTTVTIALALIAG